MALTDIACRAARCAAGRRRERFTDGLGMYLEVVPSGGKYWRLKYRFGGKEKCLALGTYPTVTLAQARRERDKARSQIVEGTDPAAARQAAKLAKHATGKNTFESVAREWHARWKATRTDNHTAYVIKRLHADVFPLIGKLPISEVTAPRLVAVAQKIEGRGALDLAKRSLQTCNQILRYAVAVG